MTFSRLTLRSTIAVSIGWMGVVGLLLAIVTGEIYRFYAIDHERSALHELLVLETNNQTALHEKKMVELGLSIQNDVEFKTAFINRNTQKLTSILNSQFHQYFVTAGVLQVAKLVLFDANLDPILASDEGYLFQDPLHICNTVISEAKKRKGADRLRLHADFCNVSDSIYHVVLTPIGSISPVGYTLVVVAPGSIFRNIEKTLGMPVMADLRSDTNIFMSESWSNEWLTQDQNIVTIAEIPIYSANGESLFHVHIARDTRTLNQKLNRTRYIIFISAAVVTALFALIALWIVEKSTISPLARLGEQLRHIRDDKRRIGETITVSGNPEIRDLADDFNAMSTELKKLYASLETLAYTDPLTNLANRSQLSRSLEYFVYMGQTQNSPFAFFLMDLNQFKSVNDTLGHQAGDVLLQQVSSRLHQVLRKSDVVTNLTSQDQHVLENETVARLGGDEFAAILPGVYAINDAKIIAQKILAEMSKPFTIDNRHFTIGISIGIAIYPQHGRDAINLMRFADIAMYKAKNENIGFFIFNEEIDRDTLQNLAIESDLRDAITDNQLRLYFQPKIDSRTRLVCGVEALVRWQHPVRGLVPPDRFIPIAEQSNLIHELSYWVIRKAFDTLTNWERENIPISIAVNISNRNLRDPNFPVEIGKMCEIHPKLCQRLIFEITESAVMENVKNAIFVINSLRKYGIQFSIDDFGTGYSSLSYLPRLPASELKIDRSFVKDIDHNNNNKIMVRSITNLAHDISLKVVAEGVESEVIADILHEIGCDTLQGYHYAKPMPEADFIAWYIKTVQL